MGFYTFLAVFMGFWIIYGLYVYLKDDLKLIIGPVFPRFYTPPVGPAEAFLEQSFPYYQSLSVTGKQRFLKRLKKLIVSKEFIGAHGFYVTDEMHYYVLACWVQLTFGLGKYKMLSFNKVMLFEEGFYSTRLQRDVKGMVSTNGVIYLSWADFLAGYTHGDDNYNLGIHELSHAFLVSTYTNGDFDVDFSSYIDEWFEITKPEFENIAAGMPSYLRDYAGSNSYEFFSVCMEVFFENPLELKTKLPDIFYHLCYLLNQNPLNTANDYSFVDSGIINSVNTIPLPQKKKRSLKYSTFNWVYSIPVVCMFSTLLSIKIYFETLVQLSALALVVIAGLAIGVFKKRALQSFFGSSMAFMFIIFACGFGLPSLVLNINYYALVGDTQVGVYTAVDAKVQENYSRRGRNSGPVTTVYLKDDSLASNPLFRRFRGYFTFDEGYHYKLLVYYHKGLFGLKVFDYNDLVKYNNQTGEVE